MPHHFANCAPPCNPPCARLRQLQKHAPFRERVFAFAANCALPPCIPTHPPFSALPAISQKFQKRTSSKSVFGNFSKSLSPTQSPSRLAFRAAKSTPKPPCICHTHRKPPHPASPCPANASLANATQARFPPCIPTRADDKSHGLRVFSTLHTHPSGRFHPSRLCRSRRFRVVPHTTAPPCIPTHPPFYPPFAARDPCGKIHPKTTLHLPHASQAAPPCKPVPRQRVTCQRHTSPCPANASLANATQARATPTRHLPTPHKPVPRRCGILLR